MGIKTQNIAYDKNGAELNGHLATPDNPKGPGVLVFHEWWGLNDYIRGRAAQLAELGYTALAADMYGGGRVAANAEEANSLMSGALGDIAGTQARFTAAYDLLKSQSGVDESKIAAIGYCFGGALVLHASRIGTPLSGVVSFHGSLGSFHKPAPGTVKARILVCHGADDALVPREDIDAFKKEMDEANADYEFKAYPGALHGFTNPAATAKGKEFGLPLAYNEAVDKQSWQDMRDFFDQVF